MARNGASMTAGESDVSRLAIIEAGFAPITLAAVSTGFESGPGYNGISDTYLEVPIGQAEGTGWLLTITSLDPVLTAATLRLLGQAPPFDVPPDMGTWTLAWSSDDMPIAPVPLLVGGPPDGVLVPGYRYFLGISAWEGASFEAVISGAGIGAGFVNVPEAHPLVDYETVEYTLRFWGADTFRVTAGGGSRNASKLVAGNFLWMPDEGDLLFLIEAVETSKDGASIVDSEVTAWGRSFEGIALDERIVLPIYPTAYDVQASVPAETAMKHYVDHHAGPSAPAERRIPNLAIAADAGAGAAVSVQGRFQQLSALLRQIGLKAGLGWHVLFDPTTAGLVFDVITGADRSGEVFFSFSTATIDSWDDLESRLDAVTLAYVAGAGPGAIRDIVERWSGSTEPVGLARREALLDAQDVAAGDTATLELRGDAVLAAAPIERRNEIVTSADAPFVFGVDYGLGDFVLLEDDETGVREAVRVTAVTKIYDESGGAPRVLPQIGQPFPTVASRVAGPAPGGGAPDTGTILDGTVTLDSLDPALLALMTAGGGTLIADGSADFLVSEDGTDVLVAD